MSSNPFDDDNGIFYVLINAEEQHCLWPVFRSVPTGWDIVFGTPDGSSRQACLDYISENWIDIRPKSIREYLMNSSQQTISEEMSSTDTSFKETSC